MDPNTTLEQIRAEIADIPNYAAGDSNAGTIAELFEALDGWLSRGGFLPTDWEKFRRPADYELPDWQAQHLTVAQRDKLQALCDRFHVQFDPTTFKVYSEHASIMSGYAEGWIGDAIYIGVEPNGDSHS